MDDDDDDDDDDDGDDNNNNDDKTASFMSPFTNNIHNQSIIPSTDVIQLTLTLNMTTARVVETSVTVNNNSFSGLRSPGQSNSTYF